MIQISKKLSDINLKIDNISETVENLINNASEIIIKETFTNFDEMKASNAMINYNILNLMKNCVDLHNDLNKKIVNIVTTSKDNFIMLLHKKKNF